MHILSIKSLKTYFTLNLLSICILASVFLFAGINKIINPVSLINDLSVTFKLNENILIPISVILPIVEFIIGTLLVMSLYNEKINGKQKSVLLISTLLFSLFLAYSIYGYCIGLKNDCGCFGNAVKSSFGWSMIIRNTIFTALSLYCLIRSKRTDIIHVANL